MYLSLELFLGADGNLEFGAEMGYHEDDSEDCKFIADKFQKFNESSINSLPGKLVLAENFKMGMTVIVVI